MNELKPSPCLTCLRVKNPGDCENKNCRVWSAWFMGRWDLIHGFYEACQKLKGDTNELEKRSH